MTNNQTTEKRTFRKLEDLTPISMVSDWMHMWKT